MKATCIVPTSLRQSVETIRGVIGKPPASLVHAEFLKAWFAIAYAYPGLHPDGFEVAGSGWPKALKPLAREAWKRATRGELSEEEFYPSDAQWAGMSDRIAKPSPQEARRRRDIAERYAHIV